MRRSCMHLRLVYLFLTILTHIAISSLRFPSQRAFLIIDPLNEYNNQEVAAATCEKFDIRLETMWSRSTATRLISAYGNDENITKDIAPNPTEGDIKLWLMNHNLSRSDIIGILCESDTGLRVAEEMSCMLNLVTSNNINEARRDKYMMQNALRDNNMDYIKQILTDDWNSGLDFIQSLVTTNSTPFPIVIKPCRGSASVGVHKANNIEEASIMFNSILGIPGYANGTISDAGIINFIKFSFMILKFFII